MNTEVTQTKICKKCGRLLPIEKFRLVKGQFHKRQKKKSIRKQKNSRNFMIIPKAADAYVESLKMGKCI